MKTKLYEMIDNLLNQSTISPMKLKLLEKVFRFGIPFNAPHGISFVEISGNRVKMKMANKRSNHNHIGTMHACSIATLGEFPAGLNLLKNLSAQSFRFVLVKLQIDYHHHGSTDLFGVCDIDDSTRDLIESKKKSGESFEITLTTEVSNTKDRAIASVHTTWQVKPWGQVKKEKS